MRVGHPFASALSIVLAGLGFGVVFACLGQIPESAGIQPLLLDQLVALVAIAAVIVLRKKATVKVLDVVVPVMAVCYFAITIFIILKNI